MVRKHIRSFIQRIIAFERCPSRLAFTCALGIYIAISPLIGLHTVTIFLFGWMFAVSIPILFAVSVLIHNPWTMVPIYALDHVVGKWLFTTLKIDYLQWDPAWVETGNHVLKEYTGITGLSLSAFFVGGNLLGIGISVMLYPVLKRIFARYLTLAPRVNPNFNPNSVILRQAQDERGTVTPVKSFNQENELCNENNSTE